MNKCARESVLQRENLPSLQFIDENSEVKLVNSNTEFPIWWDLLLNF